MTHELIEACAEIADAGVRRQMLLRAGLSRTQAQAVELQALYQLDTRVFGERYRRLRSDMTPAEVSALIVRGALPEWYIESEVR